MHEGEKQRKLIFFVASCLCFFSRRYDAGDGERARGGSKVKEMAWIESAVDVETDGSGGAADRG